jgi:hypothetical protein
MTIVNDKTDKRHKRGDVLENGMIFWAYAPTAKEGMLYYAREVFEEKQKNALAKAKEWRQNNKEKGRLQAAKWRANNPEKYKEVKARNYKKDREKHIQRTKEWREKNPEKQSLSSKNWRKNNHEKFTSILKEWRKKNPGKQRTYDAFRRAEKKKGRKELTKNQKAIITCLYEQAQRLQKKLGIPFHVDHIVPLARGGKHEPTNLQVMPARLNVQKHARAIYKWAELQLN